jgi:hypothetical protein
MSQCGFFCHHGAAVPWLLPKYVLRLWRMSTANVNFESILIVDKADWAIYCKAFLVREENFEIYKVTQIQQFSPAN